MSGMGKDDYSRGLGQQAHYHEKINHTNLGLAAQELVHAMNPVAQELQAADSDKNVVVGFKELDWQKADLDFLATYLPCSRFIFNYRLDVQAQSKSSWWAKNSDSAALLQKKTHALRKVLDELPTLNYELALEEFDPRVMTKLASWLGAKCHFQTLSVQNGNNSYALSTRDKCIGN